MKNPLHYQLSEYDCGPTSMHNAMSFLFEREEIPPAGGWDYGISFTAGGKDIWIVFTADSVRIYKNDGRF